MYNGYYYGFDMTYLVLVVPALLIATSCAGCSGIWRSPRGAMRSGL